MATVFSRTLQGPLLSASMLAIGALLGAGPALGAPQAVATGSSSGAGLPPVEALRLQDTTVFSSAAPVAFRGGSRCDADGDAFVQLASLVGAPARVQPSSSISEVIRDGRRIVVYATQLSSSDYPNARVEDFSVLPSGAMYALIFTRKEAPSQGPRPDPQYYVEAFKDDGTKDSITQINPPLGITHWFVDLLGAFNDGDFLVVGTGTASTERPSASSWHPFTAVYDPAGRFIVEVALPEDVANNFEEISAGKSGAAARPETQGAPSQTTKSQQYFEVAISAGGVINGPDGNVWILRASDPIRLYAVNSGGQVIEHFKFVSPDPGLAPLGFGFANSVQVFLDFERFAGAPSSQSGASKLVGLFNISSGRFESLYSLPETDKSFRALACSDGNGGFLYLGSTADNHLADFDYSIR